MHKLGFGFCMYRVNSITQLWRNKPQNYNTSIHPNSVYIWSNTNLFTLLKPCLKTELHYFYRYLAKIHVRIPYQSNIQLVYNTPSLTPTLILQCVPHSQFGQNGVLEERCLEAGQEQALVVCPLHQRVSGVTILCERHLSFHRNTWRRDIEHQLLPQTP